MKLMFTLTMVPLLALAACDDDGPSGPATADTADTADAANAADLTDTAEIAGDTLADTSPDATPPDATGELTLSATFEEGAKTGRNHLKIELFEDGLGVPGATLRVVPSMPMHGHGSTETPVVTDEGAGVYDAYPVTFQMPGAWLIEISAILDGRTATLDLDVMVP